MKVTFEHERTTKNTERFVEAEDKGDGVSRIVPQDEAKIGTLYVKKSTLTQMGWKPGSTLIVTLENGR